MAGLPLVEGLTQTGADAEPLIYRLADVLDRNPALMMAGQSQIMDVVGKIAQQRSTVNDEIANATLALGRAWSKEQDPVMLSKLADVIRDLQEGEDD